MKLKLRSLYEQSKIWVQVNVAPRALSIPSGPRLSSYISHTHSCWKAIPFPVHSPSIDTLADLAQGELAVCLQWLMSILFKKHFI